MKQYICDTCRCVCPKNWYRVTITRTQTDHNIEHHDSFDCCSFDCAVKQLKDRVENYICSDENIRFSKASIEQASGLSYSLSF